jgi:hypothetical protein
VAQTLTTALTVNSSGRQVVTVLPAAGGVVAGRQQVLTLPNGNATVMAVSAVDPGIGNGSMVTVLTRGAGQSLLATKLSPTPATPAVVVLPASTSPSPTAVLPTALAQPLSLLSPVSSAADKFLPGSKTIANLLRQKHPTIAQVSIFNVMA